MAEFDNSTFEILNTLKRQLDEGKKITKNDIYELASKYDVLQNIDYNEYDRRKTSKLNLPYHFMKLIIGWSPANKPDKFRVLHAKRNGIRLLNNTQPTPQITKAIDENYVVIRNRKEDGPSIHYYELTKKGIKELEKYFNVSIEFEKKEKKPW